MWRKMFRDRWHAWRALRWPVRLGLPLVLSLTSALVARAVITDLTVVKQVHMATFTEQVNQADLVALVKSKQSAQAFLNAFEAGDEMFSTKFNAIDGVGANVGTGQRFTRVPRADLKGPGQWFNNVPARITGPNAQSCNSCHSLPADDGAGGANSDVVRDPLRTGNLGQFISRNTPSVFGLGALQRLAEETTTALLRIRQNAIDSACRDGSASLSLTVQDISYGKIKAVRTQKSPCKVDVDTSEVRGVATDLVVRPFQWKGSVAFIRDFVRGAAHNELGMQGIEMTGANVDGDFDGVVNELTVGDITALTVYQAAQPRPTTLTELASLGFIAPLPGDQVNAVNRGARAFTRIGCMVCHVSSLTISNPIFSEPSQNPNYRDATFPAGQNPVSLGVDPATAITFDLSQDSPENVFVLPSGKVIRLGAFKKNAKGQVVVDLFGDLKRHEMGAGLAEPIADDGIPNSVFMTENLWGVGSTAPYLHDGRATTLAEAILEHGGEAAAARQNFLNLTTADQQALVAFLNNLVLFKPVDSIPPWQPQVEYHVGDTAIFQGVMYSCIQAHTSQTGQEPPNAPAFWSAVNVDNPAPASTEPPTSTHTPGSPTATPTETNTPIGATSTPTQAATATPISTPTATLSPSVANLALNKPATSDSQCNDDEGPTKALDGSTRTKWCSHDRTKWLQVDLGANFSVTSFVLKHAGAGGERRSWNTRDFNIQLSTDGTHWTMAVNVTDNHASVTTHSISATTARYVRLNVTAPEQGRGGAARIFELEVYGSGGEAPPPSETSPAPDTPTATPPPSETSPAPDTSTATPPPSETNLALNKPATADGQCSRDEGPAKAVNGSITRGSDDKWCSRSNSEWLLVDLGANTTVARFVVQHAGAGSERTSWNTRDFNIQVSTDGANWTTVVTVTGNTASTTTHTITATTARYVRLNVTAPQQNENGTHAARIYELEVYSH